MSLRMASEDFDKVPDLAGVARRLIAGDIEFDARTLNGYGPFARPSAFDRCNVAGYRETIPRPGAASTLGAKLKEFSLTAHGETASVTVADATR